jgi:hypothetical protein
MFWPLMAIMQGIIYEGIHLQQMLSKMYIYGLKIQCHLLSRKLKIPVIILHFQQALTI